MKRLLFFMLALLIFTTITFSQTLDHYSTDIQELEKYYDSFGAQYRKDYPNPSLDNFSYVGKNATNTNTKNTFRSVYTWINNIPQNSVITSGTLYIKFTITSEQAYPNDYIKLIIKEFPHSYYSNSTSNQWSQIDNSQTLYTSDKIYKNVNYGTLTIPLDQNFINYFQQNLNNTQFHLAFRSSDEETFGTNMNVNHLDLKINPSVDVFNAVRLVLNYEPAEITLTAKNNMNGYEGGIIGVGKNTTVTSKTSPYPLTAIKNDDINLLAYENQSYGGYNWIWNDTEGTENKSKWVKETVNNTVPLGNTQSKTYKVVDGDDGANLIGYLRKYYKIYRNDDCSEFDNVINNGVVTHIVEQNSGSISTPTTKTVNGKTYKFAGWTDNFNAPNPRTITPNYNETYTALYKYPTHSNNINAYKNNSQRKIVRIANGDLYMVYESLGKVWLEKSTDNGSTWTLSNGGQPLSGSNEAKNPANRLLWKYNSSSPSGKI